MRGKKYYIALDDSERRVVVNCLNEMRNNLIANGKCKFSERIGKTVKSR